MLIHKPGAFEGYSLIAPMNATRTYLLDMQGRVVHEWKSDYTPASSAYLLHNGDLLRPAADRGAGFGAPAAGGRIQRFTWDGELAWDFALATDRLQPHHDIYPMPNGNVLVVAADLKTAEEAIAAGRRPETIRGQLRPDCILEVKPTGKTTGEIVWRWNAWDHLIQDVDPSKPNYGDVSEHPERIDVNFSTHMMTAALADPQQVAQLRALGYIGGGARPDDRQAGPPQDARPGPDDVQRPDRADRAPGGGFGGGPGGPGGGDWMHTNSVAYNAELDQIMISVHGFSEVWIIDHSTTTAEAASTSGGRSGKGGDLLYRWGNPRAYRNGSNVDQRLFGQHSAHWIPKGLPGAGNMLVFNNGAGRPDGHYSSVDEVVLPLMNSGLYAREEFLAFGPEKAAWSYSAPDKSSFLSMFVSGAHRLPNGNTFICSGNQGRLFEVTADGDIVWEYRHDAGGPGFPGFSMPRVGEILPEFIRRGLQMTDAQEQAFAKLQAETDAKLAKILTESQKAQLAEMQNAFTRGPGFGMPGFGPPGFGPPGFGPPGGGRRGGFGPPPGMPSGGPADNPDGDAAPGSGRPGGGRGPGGGGPGGGGLFRSHRYAVDYPGLAGRKLSPRE
ncbi:MAG: aryl-sulfate sulfotransferase [Thermoguttaceae bacterium]|nr:aryl-sulfate sulfotransferase [Thermoguttaceae bacterium]